MYILSNKEGGILEKEYVVENEKRDFLCFLKYFFLVLSIKMQIHIHFLQD